MKLSRSIIANIVCERSMDAREDAVHDLEVSKDRNEGHGKFLEEMIMILMIV